VVEDSALAEALASVGKRFMLVTGLKI